MSAMSFETLLIAIDAHIALITINRPDRRNALNATVRREIIDALDTLAEDDDVRVVVVTGAGNRAFIAGADITEFGERTPEQQRAAMMGRRVFDEIAAFPKPILAMVNGFALGGGCEVALACDLRIAARTARFGQPEIRLGLIPGGGGTQRLPRLVGAGRALRMILTGDPIDADEAYRIGLADEVVDDDQLRERTMQIATAIAKHSPLTLRIAKAAVANAWQLPLGTALEQERELFIEAFASADRKEGVRAFLEKREPQFRGH
jgi:enoyl-CoA hydratase